MFFFVYPLLVPLFIFFSFLRYVEFLLVSLVKIGKYTFFPFFNHQSSVLILRIFPPGSHALVDGGQGNRFSLFTVFWVLEVVRFAQKSLRPDVRGG